MIAARVSDFPDAWSETLEEAWSVPPLMAKIRAINKGRWRSWTTLLRRDVAVALLEKMDTLRWESGSKS